MRENTYDEVSGNLIIDNERYEAFQHISVITTCLWIIELDELRSSYAIAKNTIKSEDRMHKMSSLFSGLHGHVSLTDFGEDITYTHNWPLRMSKLAMYLQVIYFLWTGFSIIMLLIGIGIMIFLQARTRETEILRLG